MGDLNDFFAKKDKKKLKNKFTTIKDIDEKLKKLAIKKEKVEITVPDEEWNIFEEKKIDYTGLKVLDVNLEDDEGTESGKEDDSQCPWSLLAQTPEPLPAEEEKPILREIKGWKKLETPVPQEKPKPTVKAYVPPHLRNRKQVTTVANRLKGNIGDMFPSLPSSKSTNIW